MKTLQKEREMEKRILYIVQNEPHSRINALQLALKTELSIPEAEEILEELSQKGYAEMTVNESGQIFYEVPSPKNSN